MNTSVGDVMSEGRNKALKTLAIFAGMLVYVGMVVYSGVHNWRLMTSGIQSDMVIWAALGVISLEISAVFLPIALHWWTHAPLQRIFAFSFYALDLALIFLNVILDYAIVSGSNGNLPAWLQMYLFFGVPATPVFAGLGWSVLFLLDPSQRERAMVETLRASIREVLAIRVAEQAKSADVNQSVELAAANLARDIVAQTLGVSASRTLPKDVIEGKLSEPHAAIRKHKPAMRFFRPAPKSAQVQYASEADTKDGAGNFTRRQP